MCTWLAVDDGWAGSSLSSTASQEHAEHVAAGI